MKGKTHLGLERAKTTDKHSSRRGNPHQQYQALQNACSWSSSMAHVRLFAIDTENTQDASGHTPVRENKVVNCVLRHLVRRLHQGELYYTESVQIYMLLYRHKSGFGGLVVSGIEPGRNRSIFRVSE